MKPTTLLFFLFMLGLAACKKEDKCETVICQNGGTCDDGTCICINSFSGQFCETAPDPCAGITCLNGGVCANGVCNCMTGYTGGDCSLQKTPVRINIVSISLDKFSGSNWDPLDGPEIYVQLLLNSSILAESITKSDVSSTPVVWTTLPAGFEMAQPTNQYTLRIMDFDTFDADDNMGSVTFVPYFDTNGFPSTLEVGTLSDPIKYTLSITYDF